MERTIIESKLNLLYEFIKQNISNIEDGSLGTGSASTSLFFYEYYNLLKSQESYELSVSEFEKSYNEIESKLNNTGFINGITGVIWLYDFLVDKDILEGDDDIFNFFDSFLTDSIEVEKSNKNYDLFYGILGYGCYFLERAAKDNKYYPILNTIVDSLEYFSIEDKDGIFWLNKFDNNINLGMAHGLPSIISFFADVYKLTQYEKALLIGKKTISWINSHKTDLEESFSVFPSTIDINYTKPFNTSRLAWCYGDLGIGYSMIKFGKSVSDNIIIEEGVKIIRKTAFRKIESEGTGIKDMGFCHGVAGLTYMYNKLVIDYNLQEFTEARNYWLNELCKGNNIEYFYGYLFYNNENKYAPDLGVIAGMAGIGLVLISILNNTSGKWDRIFLL